MLSIKHSHANKVCILLINNNLIEAETYSIYIITAHHWKSTAL